MAILTSLNGSKDGDRLLIAPVDGTVFPATLTLQTDDGSTLAAELRVTAGGAGINLERTQVDIGPYETSVVLHALSPSNTRNDTTIEVVVSGTVAQTLNLTSIENPEIWFGGRFQVRFATDGDFYNNPRGNPDGTGSGWTWALEGEPDFVPADSVADRVDKPVGRVIRFHDPVALRSEVPPIGVSVIAVRGSVGAGIEEFTSGDPVIGLTVDLGPNTYFASNDPTNPADPLPEENYAAGQECMANFEFRISDRFSGASALGPYRGVVMSSNPRDPDDRPQASGLFALSQDELTQYGIIPLQQFAEARLNQLLAAYNALPPVDQTGTPDGRNLRTRIAHLLPDVNPALRAQVVADTGITPLISTLPFGYRGKEEYRGLVNADLSIQPSESAVLSYFARLQSFQFFAKFFNFHSDELCGRVHGNLTAVTAPVPSEEGLSVARASIRRRQPPEM